MKSDILSFMLYLSKINEPYIKILFQLFIIEIIEIIFLYMVHLF
jgi:hypothetical protein